MPERHLSTTAVVLQAFRDLPPHKRRIMFRIGALMAGAPVLRLLINDFIRQSHEHPWQLLVTEAGLTALLIVFGIALMMPVFGMWLIKKVPLPRFLHRDKPAKS